MSDIELDIDDIADDISDTGEIDDDWLDDELSGPSESEDSGEESETDADIETTVMFEETPDEEDGEQKKEFITVPRLSKYEKANIIGLRASQIQAGAPPLVEVRKLFAINPINIAAEELKQRKLDFLKIKRILPSGKPEIISIKYFKL